MVEPKQAVFVSYASQDAEAGRSIREALTVAGLEVWFDQSELRGGDDWDHKIRSQIATCSLFIPVISANTQARHEGYFRLEWDLADRRSHMIARSKAFILPVCVGEVLQASAEVPESFLKAQWTQLAGGTIPAGFAEHVSGLLTRKPTVDAKTSSSTYTRVSSVTMASPRGAKHTVLALIAATALIGISGYALNKYYIANNSVAGLSARASSGFSGPIANAEPDKSIAVLPFVDMSEKKDQEYFSDGLAEELIDRLSRIPDLRVIARTSSFFFKGRSDDIRSIGSQLGVATLLEGSVRKSGNTLRVTAQLIKASDGSHMWSQSYERTLNDVFKVQDEIAGTVASALEVSLSAKMQIAGHAGGTESTDAYVLYQQGRAIDHRSNDSLDDDMLAISYLRRAIELDPGYASAWARLSIDLESQAEKSSESAAALLRVESRSAAQKALQLGPFVAEAHTAMARISYLIDWNFRDTTRHLQRALELDANNPLALSISADLAVATHHFDEALKLRERAIRSDPVYWIRYRDYASDLLIAGRYEAAQHVLRQMMDINPGASEGHMFGAYLNLLQGDADGALKEIAQGNGRPWATNCVCRIMALDLLGRTAEADDVIARLKRTPGSTYDVALVFATRNDLDSAFAWFERAYRERDNQLLTLAVDPLIPGRVRADPRFQSLLTKINFG